MDGGNRHGLYTPSACEKSSRFGAGLIVTRVEAKAQMKQVDMSTVIVVHSGEPWVHPQLPCSRQMIAFLEKNEGLVTWVQVSLIFFVVLWVYQPDWQAGSPRVGRCRTSTP